jgi:NAD(P)-dependent dehydrogenase (short-subunit alcohol dehydrogenase family)
MNVEGKVIVVTGGGNGMGRELVLNLLGRGARVVALDIDPRKLSETATLAAKWAASLVGMAVDITDKDAVDRLPDEVIARFGSIDGIINSAGIIQPFVAVEHIGFDIVDRVFKVNFYGTLHMVKAFLPYLFGRPQACIVNISSMGALVPVPGQVIYGATKAAVKLLTEGLAAELADTNVAVTVVFPGAVSTNILANSGVRPITLAAGKRQKMKRLSAAAAASIIIDGIEHGRRRVLVGSDAKFMDFLSRVRPLAAANLIQKKMSGLLPVSKRG